MCIEILNFRCAAVQIYNVFITCRYLLTIAFTSSFLCSFVNRMAKIARCKNDSIEWNFIACCFLRFTLKENMIKTMLKCCKTSFSLVAYLTKQVVNAFYSWTLFSLTYKTTILNTVIVTSLIIMNFNFSCIPFTPHTYLSD